MNKSLFRRLMIWKKSVISPKNVLIEAIESRLISI